VGGVWGFQWFTFWLKKWGEGDFDYTRASFFMKDLDMWADKPLS